MNLNNHNCLSPEIIKYIIEKIPISWFNPIFNTHNIVDRSKFIVNFKKIINKKKQDISIFDLQLLGIVQDFSIIPSNLSTILEYLYSCKIKKNFNFILSFASKYSVIFSILLVSKQPIIIYVNPLYALYNDVYGLLNFENLFKLLGFNVRVIISLPRKINNNLDVLIIFITENLESYIYNYKEIDIYIEILYTHYIKNIKYSTNYSVVFFNNDKIDKNKIENIRNLISVPTTNQICLDYLYKYINLNKFTINNDLNIVSNSDLNKFYKSIYNKFGLEYNNNYKPIICNSKGSALCCIWLFLIMNGGTDLCICSNSNDKTDKLSKLFQKKLNNFNKITFNVYGKTDITESVIDLLTNIENNKFPITTILIEIFKETKIEYKNVKKIIDTIKKYNKKTNKKTILLIDNNFLESTNILKMINEIDNNINAILLTSLCKKNSMNLTDAELILPNNNNLFNYLLKNSSYCIDKISELLDNSSRYEQIKISMNDYY